MKKKEMKEDKFLQLVTRVSSIYYRDKKKFITGVAIFVIAVVALIFFLQGRGKQNPNISLAFTEALGYYSTGETQIAEDKFMDVARRYPSDLLGIKAWYYLGNIYFNTKRYEEAKPAFERFYKKYKEDSFLKPVGLLGMANAVEELGNFAEAAKYYQELHKRYPKSPYAPFALLAAGRCYKNLGDFKNAEVVYQAFVNEYPSHFMKEEAKSQLTLVQTLENKF